MAERIGIFGGTFDPVHDGHLSIARSFLASNLIHRLLVLPTPEPPHKTEVNLTPFHHRLRMLEIAFQKVEKAAVSDLESRLPVPSYSLQTVNYLQEKSPDNIYYLCIGKDSLASFTSWYMYKTLLEKICLLVAERPGYDNEHVPDEVIERTIFVEHQPMAVSSTRIRRFDSILNLTDQISIPEEIRTYINKNNLYKNP